MQPDQIQRIYTLVRALVIITAAVVFAGATIGGAAPFTGRPEADGAFAVAFLGGLAFVFLRGGYRWEVRAGASSLEAAARAANQIMWIVCGLSLGALAGVAAFMSYPDLAIVGLCAVLCIVLLGKGAHSAWRARRYVHGIV